MCIMGGLMKATGGMPAGLALAKKAGDKPLGLAAIDKVSDKLNGDDKAKTASQGVAVTRSKA